MFRLTVVIPNLNHGKYLVESMDSALGQSRPPDEVIVLDNGSTDDSVAIVEAHRTKHANLRLVRSEARRIPPVAYNATMSSYVGTHIHFLGADDAVVPGFYAQVEKAAESNPDAGIIFGSMIKRFVESGVEELEGIPGWGEPLFASPRRYFDEAVNPYILPSSLSASTVFRQDLLLDFGGFPVEVATWADTIVLHLMALRSGAAYTPHPGVSMRFYASSWSATQERKLEATLRNLVAAHQFLSREPFRDWVPQEYVSLWRFRYRYMFVLRAIKKHLVAGRLIDAIRDARWLVQLPRVDRSA